MPSPNILTDLPVAERLPDQPPIPSSKRHYPALDGLRGVAILLVLGHHFRFILDPSRRLELLGLRLLDGGWCGVELFFVLSGFLITGILVDSRTSPSFFRSFYMRRALRIFPLYYAYLAFVFIGLATWWALHFHFNPWKDLNPTWYLSYFENFKSPHMFNDQFMGHLWSLAIEEQFYLIWPLLVFLMSRAALGLTCVVGIAAAVIARIFLAGGGVQQSFYLNTLTLASLDSLCLGALVALIIRSGQIRRRAEPWIAAVAFISVVSFILLAKFAGTLFIYSVAINTWGIFFLSAAFGCIIYWIAAGLYTPVGAILSLAPLRAIGKVSYGMYVLHPIVIGLILPRISPIAPGTPSWRQLLIKGGVMVLLAATTYGAALVSWNVLERPFLRLKAKF